MVRHDGTTRHGGSHERRGGRHGRGRGPVPGPRPSDQGRAQAGRAQPEGAGRPDRVRGGDDLVGRAGPAHAAARTAPRRGPVAGLRWPAGVRGGGRGTGQDPAEGAASGVVPGLCAAGGGGRRAVLLRQPGGARPFPDPGVRTRCVRRRQPFFDEETIEQRVAAPFGGPAVQRGQLEQPLRIGRLRHVSIQVMPTASEDHAGMGGPFTLVTPRGKPQVSASEDRHSPHASPCA